MSSARESVWFDSDEKLRAHRPSADLGSIMHFYNVFHLVLRLWKQLICIPKIYKLRSVRLSFRETLSNPIFSFSFSQGESLALFETTASAWDYRLEAPFSRPIRSPERVYAKHAHFQNNRRGQAILNRIQSRKPSFRKGP